MNKHPKIYAVCGKGGVGKTVFTAVMADCLMNRTGTGKLLLIDADPALGLVNALGADIRNTIGHVRESVLDAAETGSEDDLNEIAGKLDYMIFESIVETDKYSLLAMGRSESRGCFCSVNNLLKDAITSLSGEYDTILIDGEAGLEQINRQVVEELTDLIILTDGSARGMQTVRMLENMVNSEKLISCGKIGVVFTRVRNGGDSIKKISENLNINVFGYVPEDNAVSEYDINNIPLTKLSKANPVYIAVNNIINVL